MSMESALKFMNTPAPEPVTPTQAAQETKVNETNGLQTSEKTEPKAETPGVVDGALAATEATASSTEAPAKKDEESLSTKFAALAKKERAIVKRQQDAIAKESAFAAREAAIAEREAKIKQSDELFNSDVFEALKLRGYDYQKLTDLILSGEKVAKKEPEDPSTIATKAIEAFKKEMADKEAARIASEEKSKKDAEEQSATEIAAAYDRYRQEVKSYTKENASEYELIEMYDQHELVVETVEGYYNEHKRVLSVKEASDMVEAYLVKEAEKAMRSKKLSRSAPATKSEKNNPEENVRVTKTLNNSMVPTSASILPAASEADRMKRAMAALNSSK